MPLPRDEGELEQITLEARRALANILGYAEMLAEDLGATEAAVQDLGRIRSESLVVLELVARLEHQVEVARLKASTDPLTGIKNRRAFDLLSETCFAAMPTLSVVLIDLDHFKRVNDGHGHAAGDAVLKAVAHRLQGALRDSDVLARLAGDEFVVLLSGASAARALSVAERLRQAIAAGPISIVGAEVWVTVSVGVATRKPRDRGVHELIARADRAMYRSKDGGRNRAGPVEDDSQYAEDRVSSAT